MVLFLMCEVKKMNKNKIFLLIFFLLISILSNSLSLTKVNGIDKLSNYQEIKNIEVERIVDYFTVKRRQPENRVFVNGENKPFTGVGIEKENDSITRIASYNNGIREGTSYFYYTNGQLQTKTTHKNDIRIDMVEYYENGKLWRTMKSTEGYKSVMTGYYENGTKNSEIDVIQDYSKKGTIGYIKSGKAILYNKKGVKFAEMQFKNDSTVGQKQKFYENNRLKYEFIAGSELNEPAKPSQYYIEYYDNSDKVAMHCEEKPNGSWTCKEYKKDGTFKREKEYPTVIYKQRGTKDWINYLLPVLKVFGL